MSFHTETSPVGYARAATDLKIRMHEYARSPWLLEYLRGWLPAMFTRHHDQTEPEPPVDVAPVIADTVAYVATVWRHGEASVVAPAMTAIVAAAAQALDLTGEVLPADAAPTDTGCCYCPNRSTNATPPAVCTAWARSPGTASAPTPPPAATGPAG